MAFEPPPPPDAAPLPVRSGKKHRDRTKARQAALEALLEGPEALPSRSSTLDQNCMLRSLPEAVAQRVLGYCATAFGEGCGEIAACLQQAAEACPEGMRVKELLETWEAYREIAAFAHDATKRRALRRIYDMACGHGLLGLLLAYRFPHVEVVCVDKFKRPVFDAFLEAFREHGVPLRGESVAMSNLRFLEEDALKVEMSEESMLVAVHACNELNRELLDRATAVNAVWAVLPCCIRAGTYLPCRIGGAMKDEDDFVHTLNCGVVAGLYKAERLRTIERRITNRNIVICGGIGLEDYAASVKLCGEGRPGG